MSQILDAPVAAARARAAIAYANIRHRDLAAATGLNIEKLRKITSAKNPRGATIDELWLIADATGVTREFMTYGFAIVVQAKRHEEALARILEQVKALARIEHSEREQFESMRAEIDELRVQVGEMAVRLADLPPPLPESAPLRPPEADAPDPSADMRTARRQRRPAAGGR